jgi:hypothetical protein
MWCTGLYTNVYFAGPTSPAQGKGLRVWGSIPQLVRKLIVYVETALKRMYIRQFCRWVLAPKSPHLPMGLGPGIATFTALIHIEVDDLRQRGFCASPHFAKVLQVLSPL